MPPGDEPIVEDQDPATGAPPAPPANLTLTPELVRATPEYRARDREARAAARREGTLQAEVTRLREENETQRAAAEAAAGNAQLEQVRALLGDDGVAVWESMAGSEPVEAARQMAAWAASRVQSPPPPATVPAVAPGAPAGGTQVPNPPTGALGGNAPLGQPTTGDGWDGIVTQAQADYGSVVTRNQDPLTRNRVTEKDRAAGFMAFITGAYASTFKRNGSRPRNG